MPEIFVLENNRKYLRILGKVHKNVIDGLKIGSTFFSNNNQEVIFIGHSYDDVSTTEIFDTIFLIDNPTIVENCKCRFTKVTQQYGKEFDIIPRGWQTICLLQFLEKRSYLIENLMIINGWVNFINNVGLCKHEYFEDIKKMILNKSL